MSFNESEQQLDDFQSLLPHLRHLLDVDQLAEKEDRLRLLNQLDFLASTWEERAQALAAYFEIGRQTHDENILHEAMLRLRVDQSIDFMNALIGNISNISFLGDRGERWMILSQFVSGLIPDPSDPAVRFIKYGNPSDLDELIREGWEPASKIIPSLDVEIRLQVAWKALDVARGFPLIARVKSLLQSSFFRPVSNSQKRAWEVAGAKAITNLLAGEPELAILMMKKIPRLPSWGSRYLCREIRRYAPFALQHRQDWITTLNCPDRLPPTTVEDSVIYKALDLLETPERLGPQRVHDLTVHPDFPTWLVPLFLYEDRLSNAGAKAFLTYLTSVEDEDLRALPWKSGDQRLAKKLSDIAVQEEDARRQSIRCLLALYSQEPRSSILHEVVRALQSMSIVDQLSFLNDFSRLVDQTVLNALPVKVRTASARGTYRAVIDGSNAMFGGTDRDAGARPNLQRLLSAVRQLKEGGFEELCVYFDEGIKRQLPSNQELLLERMVANGEVIQVRYADPYLIDEFLKAPHKSELISNDRFRNFRFEEQHQTRVQSLESVGLRRRRIWARGDEILFEPTLEQGTRLLKGSEIW